MPSKMGSTLAVKKTAKEAWDSIKMMWVGNERIKAVNAQKLIKELENIKFKEGETIKEFDVWISSLATNPRLLGETFEDSRILRKFLRVVSAWYS